MILFFFCLCVFFPLFYSLCLYLSIERLLCLSLSFYFPRSLGISFSFFFEFISRSPSLRRLLSELYLHCIKLNRTIWTVMNNVRIATIWTTRHMVKLYKRDFFLFTDSINVLFNKVSEFRQKKSEFHIWIRMSDKQGQTVHKTVIEVRKDAYKTQI